MEDRRLIQGSCHCGNIRFDLQWPADVTELLERRCGCTFCQKHGGAWTSNRDASVTVRFADPARVSAYRFGTATADFQMCSVCGVVPLVTSEIDGDLFAVVNVNTFENKDDLIVSSASTDFDGEDTDSRLDRRKRNWIPNVRIDEGAP